MAETRGGLNRKCLVPGGGRHLISALLVLTAIGQLASSLRFTSVQMPALVQRGTNFWLNCQYELSKSAASDTGGAGAGEQLYSVKWYRNNEEFYRLILGGQQQQHLGYQSNGPPPTPSHQQQYFSQAGVNVLMSASNATHVRLLNASLESDGSYACEISTQNLSTIRHEKEIKVYVLPHLKLNLIGLRSLYSLGERVELNCLSDFSRPAGALGWFINGQQIKASTNSQHLTSEGHFELAASTRHKSGEPKLSRASLALKFKLTSELMRALVASTEHEQESQKRADPAGNQSKLLLMKSFVVGAETASISGARMFELLKLECRYKLTEVSDVTFNELRVAAAASPTAIAPRRTGSDSDRGISSSSSTEQPDLDDENLRRRRRLVAQHEFELTKSHGTQVSQSVCPARRAHVLAALGGVTSSAVAATTCHLGMLAREDPVILEPEFDNQADQSEQSLPPGKDWQGPLELPLGFNLSVNCSTLGALASARASQLQANFANNQRQLRHGPLSGSQSTRTNSPRWPIITMGDGDGGGDNDDRGPPTGGVYCSDPAARKRLLVSGRTWTTRSVQAEDLQQHQQQQRRHHVAYVNLGGGGGGGSNNTSRKQQAQPLDDKLSLRAHVPADTPVDGDQPRKSLVAGQLQHAAAGREEAEADEWQEEGPPPLLEWFINNQEAPGSSARYTPELPLLAASPILVSGKQLDLRARGGATSAEDQSQPLPSIDYVEYFANFERQRLVDQNLMLQLSLDKRHFTTPDSLLRLRCSSTQAQLLASDSLSISLMVLPLGGATISLVQQNLEQQQAIGQIAGAHWNQRQSASAGSGSSTTQHQIKSKYLHQYPPRSSSQARQRASAEQRHLTKGQSPGLSSASEGGSRSGSTQQVTALARGTSVCCLIISLVAILQAALL